MGNIKFTMDNIRISKANRKIYSNHVDRLVELIRKNGYIDGLPIIVDEDGWIIDGQHRFLACKKLGIKAPIVIGKTFDIVPILNSSQMKWSTGDYVNFYAAKGIEDYIILDQICKAKDISANVAYNIIFSKTVDRSGHSRSKKETSDIKAGKLKLPDTSEKGLAKLERKIDSIIRLIGVLELPRTDRLIVAITRLMDDSNFSMSVMMNKLDYQKSRVHRCSTIAEYTQMLSAIYNHKNSKKVAVI